MVCRVCCIEERADEDCPCVGKSAGCCCACLYTSCLSVSSIVAGLGALSHRSKLLLARACNEAFMCCLSMQSRRTSQHVQVRSELPKAFAHTSNPYRCVQCWRRKRSITRVKSESCWPSSMLLPPLRKNQLRKSSRRTKASSPLLCQIMQIVLKRCVGLRGHIYPVECWTDVMSLPLIPCLWYKGGHCAAHA